MSRKNSGLSSDEDPDILIPQPKKPLHALNQVEVLTHIKTLVGRALGEQTSQRDSSAKVIVAKVL